MNEPANEGRPESRPRTGWNLSQLYYYGAAVIGVGMLLGGLIGLVFGLRRAILPDEYDTVRSALRGIAHSAAVAGPGAIVLWLHLRQARRRDVRPVADIPWGSSLYYHLVALVAFVFVLVGIEIALHAAVDLLIRECLMFDSPAQAPPGDECYPLTKEGLRQMLDGGLFLVVAVPFWWWHLRRGRRLGAEPSAS